MAMHHTVCLLLMASTVASSQRCAPGGAADDAGSGSAPTDAGAAADAETPVADGGAPDATGPGTGPGDGVDASVATTGDAIGLGATDAAAPVDGGVPPEVDGGFPVPRGPTWANWPMPNPPSSGLPNPASYDTSLPGAVGDKVTGLTWEQADHDGYDTLQSAAAYCAALRLGGFTDWRLPSRIELWSIQDFTRFDPALDPVFSTVGTDARRVAPWSSTPGHGDYLYGGSFHATQDTQSVTSVDGFAEAAFAAVRCVRGSTAQPDPHYVIRNGTVHDNGTNLTWQQGYDPIPSLPNGVGNYCSSLLLDGGGWRAPSVKELETIVDDLLIAPALDSTVFFYPSHGAMNLVFWSSSPWAAAPQFSESVFVDFNGNLNGTGDNTVSPFGGNDNFLQVRCVR